MKDSLYAKYEKEEIAKEIPRRQWDEVLNDQMNYLKDRLVRCDRVLRILQEKIRRNDGPTEEYVNRYPSVQEDFEKTFKELESLGQLDSTRYKSSTRETLHRHSKYLVAATIISAGAAIFSALAAWLGLK